MIVRTGIGQDLRRFLSKDTSKLCTVGGVIFEDAPGFAGNSDGDPVFLAMCQAIETLTGVPILGKGLVCELYLNGGITDSKMYLKRALEFLYPQEISHLAISLHGKKPTFYPKLYEMRQSIAEISGLDVSQVGITATSGKGLTDCSCGDGVHCICIITTIET